MNIWANGTECLYQGQRFRIVRYWGFSKGKHTYAIEKGTTKMVTIANEEELAPLTTLDNASIHKQVLKE